MSEIISSSFIPKKEFVKKVKTKKSFQINIFFLISLIIFLSVITGAIGVYLWRQNLITSNEQLKQNFAAHADQFGIETIKDFAVIAGRIQNARTLLNNHHNILPIFTFLENNTLADIYFTNLVIKESDDGADIIIVNAKGVAPDLPDLSLQSDAYAKNPNIDNLVMSNITRSKEGFINFDLAFSVQKRFLTNQVFISQ